MGATLTQSALPQSVPPASGLQGMPTIQIDTPADGGIYLLHQHLGATYVCTDPLGVTDILSCAGPNRLGARIDTNELGTDASAVTAVNHAGQTMRVKAHYVVVATLPVPTSPLVYLAGALALHHDRISIPLGCLSPTGHCSGAATLRMTLMSRSASGRVSYRYVTVGFHTYRLASGTTGVLRVKLSSLGGQSFTPGAPLPTIILGVKQLGGPARRVVIN